MTTPDKYWVQDPCALFTNMQFFPTKSMTKEEKLNALTRLAIVIAIIMYFMDYKQWFTFLVLSVLILTVLQYGTTSTGSGETIPPVEAEDTSKESFTIVPTYMGTDFQQTVVSPTYAEEWQIPPPAYDLYTQVPYPPPNQDTFEQPLSPASYPYGQYLTKTNLLPIDEYTTHLLCGGARNARSYLNSAFLRHDLAFRENMTRIYKKSLARRFRHQTNDTFSPYQSY